MAPARHRGSSVTAVVDRIGDTLEALADRPDDHHGGGVSGRPGSAFSAIGIQSSFILGIQAGLLAFIPTVGALIGGLIIVLASLPSGGSPRQAPSCSSSACMRLKATS